MSANSLNSTSPKKWLWPGVSIAALAAWTVLCHATRIDFHHSPHLHAVPAFFLGLLVLLFANALIRLGVGARKRGGRWLVSGEAGRLCGWTLVFAVSAVALFYAVELWRGKRAWAAVAGEAAARGEPLDTPSFLPPAVPDEQNFARAPFFAPLMTVSNGLPADRGATLPGDTGQFNFVANWQQAPFTGHGGLRIKFAPWLEAEMTDLRSWMEFFRGWTTNENPAEPWSLQQVPKGPSPEIAKLLLASLRRQFDTDLDSLRAHSDRPFCRFPMDYSAQMFFDARPGPVLGGFMCILRLRASAALAAGENEPALADLRLALRLADYYRQQPWVFQARPRLAGTVNTLQPLWEGLAMHCWDERQLAAMQAQLQALDLLADYPLAVRNDAIVNANFVERIIPTSPATPRRMPGMSAEEETVLRVVRKVYPVGWSLQDQAAIHRFHLETTRRYFDLDARRIIGQRGGETSGLFASSDPLFPVFVMPKVKEVFGDTSEHFPFAQTAVDLATVACALERYRLANGGYPPALDGLVPQFVKKLPRDIVTGEPLKYRRTDGGGFVVYSVGFNQVDDGGKPCGLQRDAFGGSRADIDHNDWAWIHPGDKAAD